MSVFLTLIGAFVLAGLVLLGLDWLDTNVSIKSSKEK